MPQLGIFWGKAGVPPYHSCGAAGAQQAQGQWTTDDARRPAGAPARTGGAAMLACWVEYVCSSLAADGSAQPRFIRKH